MKNKIIYFFALVLIIVIIPACRRQVVEPTPTPIPPAKSTLTPSPTTETANNSSNKPVFVDITDFESGNNAYVYYFANYKKTSEELYELNAQTQEISGLLSKGLFLSCNNHSDSLLMCISKNIVALPNTQYSVKLDFDIATNIKSEITDQNNSTQSMHIKAGVSNVSFMPVIDKDDYFRSNWDIGSLGNSGSDGRTLGTAEKINSDDDSYQFKNFAQTFSMTTNDDGLICILIAAQSNIPSVSSIYFDNIIIEFIEE